MTTAIAAAALVLAFIVAGCALAFMMGIHNRMLSMEDHVEHLLREYQRKVVDAIQETTGRPVFEGELSDRPARVVRTTTGLKAQLDGRIDDYFGQVRRPKKERPPS